MHSKTLLLVLASVALAFAFPHPQGQSTPATGDGFFSGEPAQSCAVNPPNVEGDNVCVSNGNENTSICCPAGSACVQSAVSLIHWNGIRTGFWAISLIFKKDTQFEFFCFWVHLLSFQIRNSVSGQTDSNYLLLQSATSEYTAAFLEMFCHTLYNRFYCPHSLPEAGPEFSVFGISFSIRYRSQD